MRKVKGFTLIELLVVIAVIALLMAILIPVLRSARNQARAVVCRSNLKQWGTTLALYTQDNQGRLPPSTPGSVGILRGSFIYDNDPNKVDVYHSVSTEGIALCPMAVRASDRPFSARGALYSRPWYFEGTLGSEFEAWQITSPGKPFRSSYGFNAYLFSLDFHQVFRRSLARTNIFSLRGRANFPTLLDCSCWDGDIREGLGPPEFEFLFQFHRWRSFCINRHNGYVNGLFLDWSVRRIGLKELWTLKWDSDFDTAGRWTKAGGVEPEEWPKWMRKFKDY